MLRHNKFILGILALGISTSIISSVMTIKANAYIYQIQAGAYKVELNDELSLKEATDKNGICWAYKELSDGNIIIRYAKNIKAHMEFPSQLNGKNVTVVESVYTLAGPNRREPDTILQSIKIPSTVKVIMGRFDSKNLADVQLPSTTWVGEKVFNEAPWFEKQRNSKGFVIINNRLLSAKNQSGDITIPSNVKEIGNHVFSGQEKITSVKISDSVTIIGDDAFEQCINLKEIKIPNSITTIGAGAFCGCSNLKTIKIPNSVTEIRDNAFRYCSKLNKVQISNDKIHLGNYAFSECEKLTDMELPVTATVSDNTFEGTPWIESQADSQGFIIKSNILVKAKNQSGAIIIPSNVKKIGEHAFEGQTNITSVKIPDSVTEIGTAAFYGCSNLEKVEIPSNVKKGAGVFDECPKLNKTTPSNPGNNVKQTPSNPGNKTTVPQGWHKDGQYWNWLWSDGTKLTGWYNENGNWYYFYGNGQMAKEVLDLGGGFKYYLKPNPSDGKAAMAIGGQYIAGDWYYFNPLSDGFKGAMKRGWIYDKGNWYYFYSTGQMAHDTTIDGYYVNSNGAWIK